MNYFYFIFISLLFVISAFVFILLRNQTDQKRADGEFYQRDNDIPDMNVDRPSLFAVIGNKNSQLVFQRVQTIDEEYFYPLVDQWSGVKGLNPLLSRLCCLKKNPKDGLSHNVYALNFVKADGQNTSSELDILSFSSQGLSIGEPLKEKIPSSSIDELLQQIQEATIGTDLDGSVRISVSGEVIPGAAQRGCPLYLNQNLGFRSCRRRRKTVDLLVAQANPGHSRG